MRATIKSILHYWFTAVGWALGLTDYLLPEPEGTEGQNGNDLVYAENRAIVGLHPQDVNRVVEEDDGDEQADSE